MQKAILLFILLLPVLGAVSQTRIQVKADTVKVVNGELVINNATKNTNGYLYNVGNGVTQFRQVDAVTRGKAVQFRVGVTANFPKAGDAAYTNSAFANKQIKVWRNGEFQYRDSTEGILYDTLSGRISFYPGLRYGERVYVESADLNLITNKNFGFYSNVKNLKLVTKSAAGYRFTLKWGVNNKTLTDTPKIVGIGASTLAGFRMSFPERLTDKIDAWLSQNTTGHSWTNLAVAGYTSFDVHTVERNGDPAHNITKALSYNPDFIIMCLPGNDVMTGVKLDTTIRNYREIDSICKANDVVLFIETTQPRNDFDSLQQVKSRALADSVRKLWPDRYIEGFNILLEPGSIARILAPYVIWDNIHLTGAGTSLLVNEVTQRWLAYFQENTGVYSYTLESSLNGSDWSIFDVITDPSVMKKSFTRPDTRKRYFRIKANYQSGESSSWSNVLTLDSAIINISASRVLVDLGGDGVNTLNGTTADGSPSPSPDFEAKHWNNWYGSGGSAGFTNGAKLENLVTTAGTASGLTIKLIGNPLGTFNSGTTKAINYNGFSSNVLDYPAEAVSDNMFTHSSTYSNPASIRITGMVRSKAYKIKLWGARLDDASTPRILQAKIAEHDWSQGETAQTKYSTNATADYDQAILFEYIADRDSVDINIRPASGSSFAHISVIDIDTIKYENRNLPILTVRDTAITLSPSDSSIELSANVVLNNTDIASFKWTKVSGPSNPTIVSDTAPTTIINHLTNGIYSFRLTAITTDNGETGVTAKVYVFPDNGGKKTMRVFFSAAKQDSLPGWLNAYGLTNSAVYSFTDPVTTWGINSGGTGTNYWNPFGGTNAFDGQGTQTGNNSGAVPDLALKNYWYNANKVFSSTYNLVITGLDTSKTYSLFMLGSRDVTTTSPKYSTFNVKVGGSNQVHLQNAYGNTGQYAVSPTLPTALVPDATGKIYIGVYSNSNTGSYGQFSYLNALILKEN
ncbi:SGNH/GDSL hydrolase family protein [Foetidibacter luteolus]|uniref:SGNH/GDSL hydrolase family protein n=1 Tax=Foetidibacter luteolus TaxID=2608880 RepID=UPI00129ADDBA|nr:SGNH/GDSL hydrolase family protein [Foetidibacter luteolus]